MSALAVVRDKKEYKLFRYVNEGILNEVVSKALDDGWQLHGAPFSAGAAVCQAMTRETKAST